MRHTVTMYSARSVAWVNPLASASAMRVTLTRRVPTTPLISRVTRTARSSERGTSP